MTGAGGRAPLPFVLAPAGVLAPEPALRTDDGVVFAPEADGPPHDERVRRC